MQVRLEKEQCHSESTQSASQPVSWSVSQSVTDRFHRLPSFFPLCLCFYSMFTVASRLAISNRTGPVTKRQKKKHVSKGIGQGEESTQWPGRGVLIACPALPAVDCEMPMSMSNPSRSPGAAEPLYSLVLPAYLCTVCTAVCGRWFTVACIPYPPPHPPSAGVSGCANRSGFPHSKLLVVPVVPVVPLSCHPTPHSRPTPPWAHPESPENSPSCRGKRR